MTGRDRKLNAEERILWGKVARSTTPLKDKRVLEDWLAETPQQAENAPRIVRQADAFRQNPPPVEPAKSPAPSFDRPQRRKLEKGRVPIEARIDLHGMFQAEAHALLLSFLAHAHARGLRHVLVITGKGASFGSEGVLARSVPAWLATPPFRALVSGHDVAARRHGGEGALYIRIRRKPGRGG